MIVDINIHIGRINSKYGTRIGFQLAQFDFSLGQTETELIFRYQYGKFTEIFSFSFNQN